MLNARDESNANYDLITDMAQKVNNLKGFDTAYCLPSAGMMILSHKGVNFLIEATPLSRTEDISIGDEMANNKFKFAAKVADNDKRIKKEENENG